MTRNVLIVLGVVVVVAGVAWVKGRGTTGASSEEPAAERAAGTATRPEERAAAETLPRLVELGAGKCLSCRRMAPIITEVREAYAGRVNVESVDVIEESQKARGYGWTVIPSQVFLDADGNERWRHEGFLSRSEIDAKLKELGMIE